MHAYLVTGSGEEERKKAISQKIHDLAILVFQTLLLEALDTSIGVDQIRSFQKQLVLKPKTGSYIVGIIQGANRMTEEAQNAMLKTLEEPPPSVLLFLETEDQSQMMSTIVSRCAIISLLPDNRNPTDDTEALITTIDELLRTSPGQLLHKIESIGQSKTEYDTWLDHAMLAVRQAMLSPYTGKGVSKLPPATLIRNAPALLANFLDAKRKITNNVNPKLVMEHVFLSLTTP